VTSPTQAPVAAQNVKVAPDRPVFCQERETAAMWRMCSRISSPLVAVMFAVSGCSDSAKAQCVRSADAKICYVHDNQAGGRFDVSGLLPSSILTVTSENGSSEYTIDGRGQIDGKVGYINGTGQARTLTVTGTSADGTTLTGSFDV
jgi:hypothetical protein